MEPKDGGLVQMCDFPFNCVIFRFQLLILQGVFLMWVKPISSATVQCCCRDSLSIASDSVLHGAGPRNRGQASSGQQSMQYLDMA